MTIKRFYELHGGRVVNSVVLERQRDHKPVGMTNSSKRICFYLPEGRGEKLSSRKTFKFILL